MCHDGLDGEGLAAASAVPGWFGGGSPPCPQGDATAAVRVTAPDLLEEVVFAVPARQPLAPGLQAPIVALWWAAVRFPRGYLAGVFWSLVFWLSACPVGWAPPNQISEWVLVLLPWPPIGYLELLAARFNP